MGGQERTPFEIIRASRQGRSGGAPAAPSWWSSEVSSRPRGGVVDWVTRPIHLRISRLAILIVLLVLAALVGVAYELGTRSTPDSLGVAADNRSQEMLARARMASPRNDLVQRGEQADADSSMGSGATEPRRDARLEGVAAATPADRVPGLNYFCVMTLRSSHRANAERVAEYLRRNGVPAGVVETRSGYLQILALRGFSKAGSAEAIDFKKKLTTLGRAWKAQDGASDWTGIYAIKYQSGG